MIGLGYPGGPKIQQAAMQGDEKKIKFPIAQLKDPYNFSFSGIKTSVLRYVQSLNSSLMKKLYAIFRLLFSTLLCKL